MITYQDEPSIKGDLSSIWSGGCEGKSSTVTFGRQGRCSALPRETELPFLLATLVNESIQRLESNCSVQALLCTRQKCQRAPSVEGFLQRNLEQCNSRLEDFRFYVLAIRKRKIKELFCIQVGGQKYSLFDSTIR